MELYYEVFKISFLHGFTDSIQVSDGTMTHEDFAQLDLSCKLLFLTSCYVHNDPMLSAVTSTSQIYIGGINSISMGTGDAVAGCFWEEYTEGGFGPGNENTAHEAIFLPGC